MKQTGQSLKRTIKKTVGCEYLLFLPEGYDRREEKEWPLILFLHGSGERGNDLERVKKNGVAKRVEEHPEFPFIVVSPQCPAEQWWSTEVLALLLDEIEQKYAVDKRRIYVTGLSMGGYGTWQLALEYPERFAAIAPVCGGSNPLLAHRISHLPVWAFHGAKDKVVPLLRSREMVQALRKQKAPVRFTVYPEAGHDSWTQAYGDARLYTWFLKHSLSSH